MEAYALVLLSKFQKQFIMMLLADAVITAFVVVLLWLAGVFDDVWGLVATSAFIVLVPVIQMVGLYFTRNDIK